MNRFQLFHIYNSKSSLCHDSKDPYSVENMSTPSIYPEPSGTEPLNKPFKNPYHSTLTRAWCTLVTGIRMKVHRNSRKVSDNYSTLLVILPSPPSMYHRLHGTALTSNLDITSSMVTFQSGWVKMMDGYAFMLGQTIQGQRTIQSTTFIIVLLSQLLKKRLWIQLTHHSFTTNHMN